MLEIVLSDSEEGSELVLGPLAGLHVEPFMLGSGARFFDSDGREVARMTGQSLEVQWRAVKDGQPFGRVWWRMDVRPIA